MTQWNKLTDEDRERALKSMPDMLEGFLNTWGWLHFAKAIEDICKEKNAAPAASVQPVAWLHVGGVYRAEPEEWELEAKRGLCDELNEKHINKPTALPLYPHPPAADVQELVEALQDIMNNCLSSNGLAEAHTKARAALAKWEGK
jgi:hypothetical protein